MRIIYLYLQWMLIKIGDVVHVHTHIHTCIYFCTCMFYTHTDAHTHTYRTYTCVCMYIYCVFWCTLAPSQSISSHPRAQEWIATCPIMQLKLVVLAGARVPSYRRFMMPLLSVAVLLCGTASMFTGDALRFGWYGFGLCCLTWGLWGLWGLKKIDGTNPNGNSSKYDSELQVN